MLQGSVSEYCFHNCKSAPVIIVPGKGTFIYQPIEAFFHTVCFCKTKKPFVCCKAEAGEESIVSWAKSGDSKP